MRIPRLVLLIVEGSTYADTRTAGVIVGEGIVLDVNSLYPSVVHDRPLPCGVPHKADWIPEGR